MKFFIQVTILLLLIGCSNLDNNGFNTEGIHNVTKTKFNQEGYNQRGYNKEGFDKKGFDKYGYDKNGYNIIGFNEKGFDKDGFDKYGFNTKKINKITKTTIDENGFSRAYYIYFDSIRKMANQLVDAENAYKNRKIAILNANYSLNNYLKADNNVSKNLYELEYNSLKSDIRTYLNNYRIALVNFNNLSRSILKDINLDKALPKSNKVVLIELINELDSIKREIEFSATL